MERYYADYLDKLQAMHAELHQALEGLAQPALDWAPAEGVNSLAVLAIHTVGAERFLMGDCIAREPTRRDREAEFHSAGLPADVLLAKLEDSLAYAKQVLDQLTLADLEGDRIWRDKRVSVGWLLEHLLSHTAIHAGHAQVTRQWWDLTHK
jgi:DinB superfamily